MDELLKLIQDAYRDIPIVDIGSRGKAVIGVIHGAKTRFVCGVFKDDKQYVISVYDRQEKKFIHEETSQWKSAYHLPRCKQYIKTVTEIEQKWPDITFVMEE